MISHNKLNRFQWFLSLSVLAFLFFGQKLDFFHLSSNEIIKASPDQKPWLNFLICLRKSDLLEQMILTLNAWCDLDETMYNGEIDACV